MVLEHVSKHFVLEDSYKIDFYLEHRGIFQYYVWPLVQGPSYYIILFLHFGYSIFEHAMHVTQGVKLGYYMGNSPRITVFVSFDTGI